MFPRIDTPKKDLIYHRQWAKSILTSSITDNWSLRYRVMAEAYKFFLSGSSGELTNFLQKGADGQDLPAMWLSISSLQAKIEMLIGELEQRGYEINVKAVNKEATSRKLEEKEKLRVARRLQPAAQYGEQQTGLPLQDPQQQIPQTDKELDDFMDLSFKDKAELIMEAALKFTAKMCDWDETRKEMFRDVWIAGKCIARNEIVRGLPRSVRVNPLCFIYDRFATNDNLTDATYFGEVYYMTLGEAAERFNLTDDELAQANNAYNQFIGMSAQPLAGSGVSLTDQFFDAIPNATLGWFKNIDNVPRVLVARTCWSDYKVRKYKDEVNAKYGTEHLQEITNEVRARGKSPIITSKMNVWRQCTLIGGTIVREWGECPNQARELSTLEQTEPPYKIWVPNFIMGTNVSKTEQVVGLELLRDICMYNMQLAMNRSAGKVFVYDVSLKPDNMEIEKVLGYAKSSGIILVNTREYNMTAGSLNVMQSYDLSMSQVMNQYIESMAFLDSQINTILGTSPERQGDIPAASQAVGVTQLAVAGSSKVTFSLFSGYERFCSRVLNQQAKFIKIAWANSDREMFAPIVGDVGIDFLKANIDIDLDEFNTWVTSLPPMLADRQKFETFVGQMVMGGQLDPVDALQIVIGPDTKVALRILQRKTAIRKMLEAQQSKDEQERDAQLQQNLQATQQQHEQTLLQGQAGLQTMKGNNALAQKALVGRVKIADAKIKALSQ